MGTNTHTILVLGCSAGSFVQAYLLASGRLPLGRRWGYSAKGHAWSGVALALMGSMPHLDLGGVGQATISIAVLCSFAIALRLRFLARLSHEAS